MTATTQATLAKIRGMTAKDAGGGNVAEFFEANKGALLAVLPQHMTPDRMLKTALGAIRTTPALKDCTVASLFGALVQAASLGLEPNTVLGHAYLVPFYNGREQRRDVQLIVGYRGLIDLARRSGQIVSIAAWAVREADSFDVVLGTDARIEHRPHLGDDRGEIAAFYAVAHLKDGGVAFEVMSRAEVYRIRDGSKGYQDAKAKGKKHPWITDEIEMGRKTVIRRLSKYLPLSIELATAVDLDERADDSRPQDLHRVIDGTFSLADQADEPSDEQAGEQQQEQAP